MNQAHDDEGIIDLRALASAPPPPRSVFPVSSPFSEPTPDAFALDANGTNGAAANSARGSASKAKTIGIIAAAVAFVVLSGVGVAFAFRGEKAAVISSAPPVTLPTPAVAAAAPPAPVADPAPAASATADDAPAEAETKKGKGKGRAGGAKAKSFSGGAPTKPAVTKAADPCQCHGDFQCNIRCAANK